MATLVITSTICFPPLGVNAYVMCKTDNPTLRLNWWIFQSSILEPLKPPILCDPFHWIYFSESRMCWKLMCGCYWIFMEQTRPNGSSQSYPVCSYFCKRFLYGRGSPQSGDPRNSLNNMFPFQSQYRPLNVHVMCESYTPSLRS